MSLFETMIAGFIAGGSASLLTNPIDVIKTNLMSNKDKFFDSYWNCVKFLYQEDGLKAFARGFGFRFIHVGIMSMVFFSGYEKFLNFCIRKHAQITKR